MVRSQGRKSLNEPGMSNGEILKRSLADDAGLDEDVISVKLALDVVALMTRYDGDADCRCCGCGFMLDIQKW